ncbi:Site-specific DNA recombinase [Catalinimonas alkaloidigena]|uniref:Site-specific DNA recombinase n=1 Tax=Catalinimonas alkaloidigena TaxID=1075417 RepID=A0A1G9ALQ1_9BACT|nr:recombinase family protein [Catalinimonas alkaloidigena]SDK27510.1 Site-specific DNA recombinase [Catalinimonas alkaloidigena]
MNVALFARVSTVDKQDTNRQINELTDYCRSNGWNINHVITEKISGRIANDKRPGVALLRKVIASGKLSKIVVSEVSRLGRDTREVLNLIHDMKENKVSLHIMNYQLDTLKSDGTENSMGQLLITLLADIARMETQLLSERVRSGMAEAKRKGKHVGRPKGSNTKTDDYLKKHKVAVSLLVKGVPIRKVAAACNCSTFTVQCVKQKMLQKCLIT